MSSPPDSSLPTRPLSVSVVFPAYQEEQYLATSVGEVVSALRDLGADFEVLVVENGSIDRTREVADGLAETYPEVRSLWIDGADYGRALRHGLLSATKDYVANFDVDLYDVTFFVHAHQRMSEPGGPSIIVGSKRGDGSLDQRHWTRKLVTMVFSTMLRVGFGLKVSDTHGMKVMRRADVEPHARRCQFGTDLFDTELVLRSERAGLRTGEIGVTVAETRPARTPIASRILRSLRGLARLWWALRRERRSSPT